MLLSELANAINTKIGSGSDTEVLMLSLDSRECRAGTLYFALNGTRVDGHKYIEQAKKNGAVAAVVEHICECDIPQVVVEDSRSAMSVMAAAFYGFPSKDMKMIGVTGTNGKTTVSFMLRAIALANGINTGVIGTSGIYFNNEKLNIKIATATTPDPIELQYILAELKRHGAQWVIMEVTAHALDLNKIDGISFVSASFTNLTQDHLDYFVTMENYFAAKKRFFLPTYSQNALVNIDDGYGAQLNTCAVVPTQTYSCKQDADFRAKDITIGAEKSEYTLLFEKKAYKVEIACTGMFNISNSMCAIGAASQAGLEVDKAICGIKEFMSVPGRFESVSSGKNGVSVIIDYAHTPDGLENILNAVNAFKKGRLICVFGCGGNRDALKRPIMGNIAGRLSDFSVITSDNPRYEDMDDIIRQIEAGIKKTDGVYVCEKDRKKAICYALEIARQGDVIAICGKGDEDYQEINGVKHHFSDRETVEEIAEVQK